MADIAPAILRELGPVRLLLLRGGLGAGKTTLVQALSRHLGVEDHVTSPTFSLINEYLAPSETVYHIDLYRLESLEEALQIGIEDYLDSGNWCFVEWPELLAPILTPPYAVVEIGADGDEARKIRIFKVHAQDSNE